MARMIQLPCDRDGLCMKCKTTPPPDSSLKCTTCVTPWHVSCLSSPPETLASTLQWTCPDCAGESDENPLPVESGPGSGLVAKIRAIEADASLSEGEKAKRRQELVSGKSVVVEEEKEKEGDGVNEVLAALGKSLNCSFCMNLPQRPVTTPCGHNFCLECFKHWTKAGKDSCAKCRNKIPQTMLVNPRINSSLVAAIRLANGSKIAVASTSKVFHFVSNQNKPDKAYTTDRAKKPGKANAASGKIYVTIPSDHLGPIPAENDPVRNQGVLVGECWPDRLDCMQWGAHFKHVAGIAGQADFGAQSVALSGGYVDDVDNGEWFIYTGSGGKDLSGNKRTNKEHSSDQKFHAANEALRVSCKMGYPVRVVRSWKEKRSAYAPTREEGVRYDGIYRIEKCWRKIGEQGIYKVCRYLFIRCDNDPAPWTSDEHGDLPRDLPLVDELEEGEVTDLCERKESPSWDYDASDGQWKWVKPPPASRKKVNVLDPEERRIMRKAIKAAHSNNIKEKLLKEFCCQLCKEVMTLPVTTPCAHSFCKACLEAKFAGISLVKERSRNGRTLRSKKNVMTCPRCPTDISDYLQNLQVNREVMEVIEKLKKKDAPVDEGECSNSEENEEMVIDEAEPPKKKAKLASDTVVAAATMVVSG